MKSLIIVLIISLIVFPSCAGKSFSMPLDMPEIFGPSVPREFPSLEFFERWRDRNLLLYIDGKPYRLPIETFSPVKDCDDVAEAWQRRALKDGYLVSAQIIQYGKLLDIKVSQSRGKHDGIRANIKNDVYYLDTFSPYEITWVCRRD